MTKPNDERITQAFKRVLETVVGQHHAAATTTLQDDPNRRLSRFIERVKAEASEVAALVAECAPHGRAMLTKRSTSSRPWKLCKCWQKLPNLRTLRG